MLKFLFGKLGSAAAAVEKQRETVERLTRDLNAIVAGMSEKPKITVDTATGAISYELPEQMPDEALALPRPDETSESEKNDADQAKDTVEKTDETAETKS